MTILKIIFAIVFANWLVNDYFRTSRDKAIAKAKRDGKSWQEIYDEFYKY